MGPPSWLERPARRTYGKAEAQQRLPLHPVVPKATTSWRKNAEPSETTWGGGLGLGVCVGSPTTTVGAEAVRKKKEVEWVEEDAVWLVDSLKRRQSSFGGFGKKIVLRIPRSWRRARRSRIVSWCEELGFQCVASAEAESTLLEMDRDERRVAGLVADLEKGIAAARRSSVPPPTREQPLPDQEEAASEPPVIEVIVKEEALSEKVVEPSTPEKTDAAASNETPAENWRRASSIASPRSKLRRRRTIAARRASLNTQRPPRKTAETRVVVGGWLTGEVREGRAVVDCTRFSESRHGAVAAIVGNRLRIASRDEGQRWVEIVDRGCATWPRGRLLTGADGRHYVVLDNTTENLPRNEVETCVVDLMLRFAGSDCRDAAVVCWGWSRGAARARAWRLSRVVSRNANTSRSPYRWEKVFASGTFLAEGAFKRVYRVERRGAPPSALSVSNLDLLGDSATLAASRELEVAFLTTSLASRVPHFVETYSAGLNSRSPPESGWTNNQFRRPRGSGTPQGNWLFSRMELCGFGDLQEWVSSLPESLPELEHATRLLFQMSFAVYAGRAEFAMRHYDLKLLNFLAAPADDCERTTRYVVGSSTFDTSSCPVRAKLADFGTAWLGARDLDREPTEALLTTLENAPIELLASGCSKSSFAADTFSLGLAALHLFTGDRPYEEIMDEVRCPQDLCASLAGVWLKKTQFSALARLARDVDQRDPDPFAGPGGEKLDRTLFDTFYRYLVLFSSSWSEFEERATKNNADSFSTYGIARDVLLADEEPRRHATRSRRGGGGGGKKESRHRTPDEEYREDCRRYSLAEGDHPSIARARRRLDHLGPDAKSCLLSMVDFDPARRPTMRALLLSPLFSSLVSRHENDEEGGGIVDAYGRSPSNSSLPLPDV